MCFEVTNGVLLKHKGDGKIGSHCNCDISVSEKNEETHRIFTNIT